jgi:uncharacterized membrane protein YidH (DUF202 family)
VSKVHDEQPGLAGERTTLAWTRTALSFGAVGGVIVKDHVVIGLVVMAIAPAVWYVGRLTARDRTAQELDGRLRLITAVVVAVSIVAFVVAFLGRGTSLRAPLRM